MSLDEQFDKVASIVSELGKQNAEQGATIERLKKKNIRQAATIGKQAAEIAALTEKNREALLDKPDACYCGVCKNPQRFDFVHLNKCGHSMCFLCLSRLRRELLTRCPLCSTPLTSGVFYF